jgi:hypothetical protein
MTDPTVFSLAGHMPAGSQFGSYQRYTDPVQAFRVAGPFAVLNETEDSQEATHCSDGWLIVRGDRLEALTDEEFVGQYGHELPNLTVAAHLRTAARQIADRRRNLAEIHGPRSEVLRELALAATAIEDAEMRYTRARAKEEGCFVPIDLDDVDERMLASDVGGATLDELSDRRARPDVGDLPQRNDGSWARELGLSDER